MASDGEQDKNEYHETALQIFDYCGVDRQGKLRVDSLLEKLSPFVKTNKSEFTHLKSLLDPEEINPEINVTMLSDSLGQYSDSQKAKLELEESFNLRSGTIPQDSDSGISDGFQVLEELQCELREKARQNNQLRSQLDYTERQHEEVVSTLTAEISSLKSHLNVLNVENSPLTDVRRDYESMSERLCSTEAELNETKRLLDAATRRAKKMEEQCDGLVSDNITLKELLHSSKAECHRINDMYASRQVSLIKQYEALRTECADLATQLHDQHELTQQLAREKVILEMDLKELLNKSIQMADRSIDVSYIDDHALTELDTLNCESQLVHDNSVNEDSLLHIERGSSNMSLFDEIRLSFGGKDDPFNLRKTLEKVTVTTQTGIEINHTATQTNFTNKHCTDCSDFKTYIAKLEHDIDLLQPDVNDSFKNENNLVKTHDKVTSTDTLGDDSLLVKDIASVFNKLSIEDDVCRDNQINGNTENILGIVDSKNDNFKCQDCEELKSHIARLKDDLKSLNMVVETLESGRLDGKTVGSNNMNDTSTNIKDVPNTKENQPCLIEIKQTITKEYTDACFDCKQLESKVTKLKTDLKHRELLIQELKYEIEGLEENLELLRDINSKETEANVLLKSANDELAARSAVLEDVLTKQQELLEDISSRENCMNRDTTSVSSQTDIPCGECVKRTLPVKKTWSRFLWDGVTSLFWAFASLCFIGALFFLYQVSQYHFASRRCIEARAVPWKWLNIQDLLDLIFRIEYVGEVPM